MNDKIEMELKPFEMMCEKATDHLKELITGSDCVDPSEIMTVAKTVGEIIDMKKDVVEMCYKKKIIEAMDEEEVERYGYNNRRYASGRYAPRGRGHYGYRPYMAEEDYEMDYMKNPEEFNHNMRMGYRDDMHEYNGQQYGKAYNGYRMAKRHYTQTNDAKDKAKMVDHAKEHLTDTVSTMREMWNDADYNLRVKIKDELANLVKEMGV